jgi:hypothetical protein
MINLSDVFVNELDKISYVFSDFAQEAEGIGGKLLGALKGAKPGAFVAAHPTISSGAIGGLGALALLEHHRRKKAETGHGLI